MPGDPRAAAAARWASPKRASANGSGGGSSSAAGPSVGSGGKDGSPNSDRVGPRALGGISDDSEEEESVEYDGASLSNVSKRSRGQHGARDSLDPQPELERSARKRKAPKPSYVPESKAKSTKKAERKRKDALADAVKKNVSEQAYIGDARTTAYNMAKTFRGRCCDSSELVPLAPRGYSGSCSR